MPLSSPGDPPPNVIASWDSVQAAVDIEANAWTLVALTSFTDLATNAAVASTVKLVTLSVTNTGEVAVNVLPRKASTSIAGFDGTAGTIVNPGETLAISGLYGLFGSAAWVGLRAYTPPAYSGQVNFTTTVRMFAECYSLSGVI